MRPGVPFQFGQRVRFNSASALGCDSARVGSVSVVTGSGARTRGSHRVAQRSSGERVLEGGWDRGAPSRGSDARVAPANPATTTAVSTDSATRADPATADPPPGRAPTASACEPYRELIFDGVRRGRNAMAIWQDLVDGYGFTGRYASVRRFVRTHRAGTAPDPCGIIITAPPVKKGRSTTARGRWCAIP